LEQAKRNHKGKYKDFIIPRVTNIARGARLSEERIQSIVIGEDLTPEERYLFLEILFAREEALAWDFSEIGCVKPELGCFSRKDSNSPS
jgi:hypothetical protein